MIHYFLCLDDFFLKITQLFKSFFFSVPVLVLNSEWTYVLSKMFLHLISHLCTIFSVRPSVKKKEIEQMFSTLNNEGKLNETSCFFKNKLLLIYEIKDVSVRIWRAHFSSTVRIRDETEWEKSLMPLWFLQNIWIPSVKHGEPSCFWQGCETLKINNPFHRPIWCNSVVKLFLSWVRNVWRCWRVGCCIAFHYWEVENKMESGWRSGQAWDCYQIWVCVCVCMLKKCGLQIWQCLATMVGEAILNNEKTISILFEYSNFLPLI